MIAKTRAEITWLSKLVSAKLQPCDAVLLARKAKAQTTRPTSKERLVASSCLSRSSKYSIAVDILLSLLRQILQKKVPSVHDACVRFHVFSDCVLLQTPALNMFPTSGRDLLKYHQVNDSEDGDSELSEKSTRLSPNTRKSFFTGHGELLLMTIIVAITVVCSTWLVVSRKSNLDAMCTEHVSQYCKVSMINSKRGRTN